MLYRVIIGNFKSFDEEQEFNMFPYMGNEDFPNHIYDRQTLPVLKQTAIYGANGSGKSNFIKALLFLQGFATQPKYIASEAAYIKNRFRLPPHADNSPISMAVEFGAGGIVFVYLVEIDDEGVSLEKLLITDVENKEKRTVFTRSKSTIDFAFNVSDDIKKFIVRNIENNPLSSFLSLNINMHFIEDESINIASDWFDKKLEIITFNRTIPSLISYLRKNNEVLEFVNNVFKEIGLGINKFDIREEPFEEWIKRGSISDKLIVEQVMDESRSHPQRLDKMKGGFPIWSVVEENGEKKALEFVFSQIGKDNYEGQMESDDQSDGTLRLLTLLPSIHDIFFGDKTLVVDEIDQSIHPLLIMKLLKYFGRSDTKGQLIYTTHQSVLLSQRQLLRPDEVWFAQKYQGATKLYSLNDFNIHDGLSIEDGYLDGRFGAIPIFGSLK